MHVKRRLPRPDPLLRAATLHDGVGTARDRVDALFPPRDRRRAGIGIDLPAEMVDDDGDVGVRLRQPCKPGQTLVVRRVVVVAEAEFPQYCVALLEPGVDFGWQRVAYPAKVGRSGDVCLEYWLYRLAELEIGAGEDSRAQAHVAVLAGPAHRGHAVNELRLSDAPHLLGAVGTVEGAALGKDRLHHVVTGDPDVPGYLLAEIHFSVPSGRADPGRRPGSPRGDGGGR